MKRNHVFIHTKVTLLLLALGCLFSAAPFFRPVAARVVAPQDKARLTTALRKAKAQVANKQAQAALQDTTLGVDVSTLEMHDGKLSCRAATSEESWQARRTMDVPLHVLRDETQFVTTPEETPSGLKIILQGTEQLERHTEAKAAFLRAARVWESLIQDRITVIIDVDFGPTRFGRPFNNAVTVGESSVSYFTVNYAAMRESLLFSASSPQELALYRALPEEQCPTDLGTMTKTIMRTPQMRALWWLPRVPDLAAEKEKYGGPLAAEIGFNSTYQFDFDPSDGTAKRCVDFHALALHEIGHILGFTSAVGAKELNPSAPLRMELLDVFRLRPGATLESFGVAPRILSSGGNPVFFDGGPEVPFSTARYDMTGGDGYQAGHWKNDYFTLHYRGIMDPDGAHAALRDEITENDLRALSTVGYHMNPLLNPPQTELRIDDGVVESALPFDGLMVVNRLTPPAYPATLQKLRLVVPEFEDQQLPTGKPFTLLIYAPNQAIGQLPNNAPFTRINTIVPSVGDGAFLEFPIPNGPTINAGDFWVGYQLPTPHQDLAFALDETSASGKQTFVSMDNGASFQPLTEALDAPANAMIRAIVTAGPFVPTPTPLPIPTPRPETQALTSGVPVDGLLLMGHSYGMMNRTQYTIEVPANATQLKVELVGERDVDLAVRYGTRVGFNSDGHQFLTDIFANSADSFESVALTPTSTPALKPGTYYFGVINCTSGPDNFTIVATVSLPGAVTSVSAASFNGVALAPDSITAAFGSNLATRVEWARNLPLPLELGGTTVKVLDSAGKQHAAPLFYVSASRSITCCRQTR